MRSFRFESISLLSRKEKRGRKIEFHPKKNLLLGLNHTGKSTIIKSLFSTLGAEPKGTLEKWDPDAVSLVRFRVRDALYQALHVRGHRALFDDNGNLIMAARRRPPFFKSFAEITGFNLVLTDKRGQKVTADSSCFFLPFYIDQDVSWQGGRDTFNGLGRYREPWKNTVEYFSGVRPPEYYQTRAKRDQEQDAVNELQRELDSLKRARRRFDQTLPLSGPKINAENFEEEVRLLTDQMTTLNEEQERVREAAVRQQELKNQIQHQIDLARRALGDYYADEKIIRDRSEENLECPTCGAEHDTSFMELLSFADDARLLFELVVRLESDAEKLDRKYESTRAELGTLSVQYKRISEILDTRRGQLRFREVIESMGAESAFTAFRSETEALQRELIEHAYTLKGLEDRLKQLVDSKRSAAILEAFRRSYAGGRQTLQLPQLVPRNT